MGTIYLVRHGKAAAGYGSHRDPGLDDMGRSQAADAAAALAPKGPLPIYSSPLARAKETAAPLAERWSAEIIIEPRVAEIPAPSSELEERASWLRRIMPGNWSEQDPSLQRWRRELLDWLLALPGDSVIFSHYIAINAAVGAAQGSDRLVVFAPDNGSVTTLSTGDGTFSLIELGRTGITKVN